VPAYRYSTRYGPRAPTFSRAALADAGDSRVALFVSGTASIVGEESVHAGDLIAQLAETLRNLDAVIAAASARCTAALRLADLCCTVYVRRAADVAAVRAGFEAALGNGSLAAREAVYLQADVCRADLLLEIEAHTITAGALA
jgi:enamine deaminase RidA (YjgF/YER057c/UK114 family)